MSNSCEFCGQHVVDCCCTTKSSLGFTMPCGGTLEIHSSKPIDQMETACDEEIEGVVFNVFWDGEMLPWCTKTRLQAMAIALGCQWGANEMIKKVRSYNEQI